MDTAGRQSVYVDVLIATNFMINYMLLTISSRLAGRSHAGDRPPKWRLMLAAFLGALFSLSIFLPNLSEFGEFANKFLSSGLMILVANRFHGVKEFGKEWLFLFLVTALFGGLMLAAQISFLSKSMLCANGVVYFHISPVLLIINITAAYVIVCLADRIFQSSHIRTGIYPVSLTILGKTKKTIGLVDTGNSLTEPFSGLPVVVCGIELIEEMFPPEWKLAFHEGSLLKFPEDLQAILRMVPYCALGGDGVLPAIRGELLTVELGKGFSAIESFYIAISKEPVGHKDCPLLLSPALIQTGTMPEKKGAHHEKRNQGNRVA